MNQFSPEASEDPETDGGLTVCLYGDFRPWALGSSYRRAFERLGHRVVPIDQNELFDGLPFWMRGGPLARLGRACPPLRRQAFGRLNESVTQNVREADPDFFFVINGDWLLPETLKNLRKMDVPTSLFHADDPLPGSPNEQPGHLDVAREYTGYFIWSRRLCRRLEQAGVRNVEYLPFAWDPELYPPGVLASDPEHDVVFIGGWDEWREQWLEPVAEQFDLKIWGPSYWGTRTDTGGGVRAAWQGKALRGAEVASTIRQSKIVLNIFREQNLPDGTNMRTFEVPGAGGFQLSHWTEGAAEIFRPGEAGVYFETKREMVAQIARYLQAPESRVRIARQAHRTVEDRHRYVDRAVKLLCVTEFP